MNIKKSDIALIAGVVLVIIVAIFTFSSKKEDPIGPIELKGEAGVSEINYEEYEEKINSDEAFVVAIINDGCSYCEMYEPVMEEVANEYELPIYTINLAHLKTGEYEKLSASNTYLKRERWGTPTTLLLKGKKVVDSIGGYTEKDGLVSFFEEHDIIKTSEVEENIEE